MYQHSQMCGILLRHCSCCVFVQYTMWSDLHPVCVVRVPACAWLLQQMLKSTDRSSCAPGTDNRLDYKGYTDTSVDL